MTTNFQTTITAQEFFLKCGICPLFVFEPSNLTFNSMTQVTRMRLAAQEKVGQRVFFCQNLP